MTGAAQFPRWLLRKPSDDAVGRVFCFPYSGVGASMFNRWPERLGAVEVCPIQLPARENRIREPHYGTYGALAENLVEHLLPYLDRPFALFGHCAGSLPAFETVAALVERDLPTPRRLVVSAQVAPHHCPRDRYLDMNDAALSGELRRLVIARGGHPHPLLIELSVAVLREDLAANRVYKRDRPVPVPIGVTVLHWAHDVEIAREELAGWSSYAEDVDFVELDGGHHEFLSAPPPLLDLLHGCVTDDSATYAPTGACSNGRET
jgi:surfactin synthase thioesterase subunit